MKTVKVLAIIMLAVFSYSAVNAQMHHRPHYKRHWHPKRRWSHKK